MQNGIDKTRPTGKSEFEKGKQLHDHQQYLDAIPHLRKALDTHCSRMKALDLLSLCLAHTKQYKEAMAFAEECFELAEDQGNESKAKALCTRIAAIMRKMDNENKKTIDCRRSKMQARNRRKPIRRVEQDWMSNEAYA